MKYYETTRQFAKAYRAEHGCPAPDKQSAVYVVGYRDGTQKVFAHAPRSYRYVTKVLFVVDHEGVAERVYGKWLADPTDRNKYWLLNEVTVDQLSRVVCSGLKITAWAPFDMDPDVRERLDEYAHKALDESAVQINEHLVKRMVQMMHSDYRYRNIGRLGYLLNQVQPE